MSWYRPTLLSTSGAVLSFAVTAAVLDVISFSGGLTQHIIKTSNDGTSSLLRFLSLQWPSDGQLTAIIGIGDLAVLTALYLALASLGYRAWQALFLPLAGLLIGILIGTLIGGVFGIPESQPTRATAT